MIVFFRIRVIPGETSITGALVGLGHHIVNSNTVRSVACVSLSFTEPDNCHESVTTALIITLYIPLSTV